jgi:uncharacterized LabA/DUF88 family protein
MPANYFFIDGSALTAQIRVVQRLDKSYKDRRLCPKRFIAYYADALHNLVGGEYKRATFYFPIGDEQTAEEYLEMPDHKKPGEIRDIHFKFCGQKLKKSGEFLEFVETQVPDKWKDRFSKSEKGIDIEMCCDAFRLASAGRIDRLFLLSNDDDFIPFCRTIKEFGANISIVHLSDLIPPNQSLLRAADTYDVVQKQHLQQLFLPIPENPPAPQAAAAPDALVSALKEDAPTAEQLAAKPAAMPASEEADAAKPSPPKGE